MRHRARWSGTPLILAFFLVLVIEPLPSPAQQQVLGIVAGRVGLQAHQPPPQRVLVSLLHRGAPIASVYTDSQGAFDFPNLPPDVYQVSIDDPLYRPVHETAVIEAHSLTPVVHLDIILVPRNAPTPGRQQAKRPPGANPHIADVREYSAHFPKKAVKEFEKGVSADRNGKNADALKHYLAALKIAPDFYPAHNNLGSDYLAKADFAAARSEFEQVVLLNQSDAEGYFNLSNVCMLMGDLANAQMNLDKGMQRQPDSAFGQFLLGSLNMRTGNIQRAEAALRRALELSPLMVQARLQLVNLYLREGRNSDAAAELRQFLAAFPASAFAPKARQLLQKLESGAANSPGQK